MNKQVLVIGAGMAGVEASFFLASRGIRVHLVEGKKVAPTPAQTLTTFAELVCTNSLKSIVPTTGHGLLKKEMSAFSSLILKAANNHQVPAGDALAVEREGFSQEITQVLKDHPLINVIEAEASDPLALQKELECAYTIICTGPLTTKKLERWIVDELSSEDFYFYDAIAPIVDADSLNYEKLFFKDRHKPASESADYLNAPMDKEQYLHFIEELRNAKKVSSKEFEDWKFFESCLPVDLMAERGVDTPRFSCMKPIGLDLEGEKQYAVVQLRRENLLGSAYNLVGFQTRLTYPEQKRVFRMIPGFEEAEFISLGSVHRNSFLNSRKLLNADLSTKKFPSIYFAGQIIGVEGYTESATMGIYAALQVLRKIKGERPVIFPVQTCIGALVNYVLTCPKPVPSSMNFGLLPGLELTKEQRKHKDRKKIKKQLIAKRASEAFDQFVKIEGLH